MLTAQPQAGRDSRYLAMAALRDIVLLERGAKMRTLYQHSARRSSVTHKYVAAVTARGAEVRTLDEFFNRMIVVDRRVAVIPNQEDLSVAVAVREPAVVAYLVDVFERSWERARPFTNRETSLMKDIAAEQRAMTMRMLIEGHSDPMSAKRLGRQPAHLRRLRRGPEGPSTTRRPASSSATRWAGWASRGQEPVRGRAGRVTPSAGWAATRGAVLARTGPKLHEGSDLMVTALVLLRRAWGVRRWDRTSGGKVGSPSQTRGGVLSAAPAGVARTTPACGLRRVRRWHR